MWCCASHKQPHNLANVFLLDEDSIQGCTPIGTLKLSPETSVHFQLILLCLQLVQIFHFFSQFIIKEFQIVAR